MFYRLGTTLHIGHWRFGRLRNSPSNMFEFTVEKDCVVIRIGRMTAIRKERYGYRK